MQASVAVVIVVGGIVMVEEITAWGPSAVTDPVSSLAEELKIRRRKHSSELGSSLRPQRAASQAHSLYHRRKIRHTNASNPMDVKN